MTLLFPDVSSYTPVDPGRWQAIIARATLSDRVRDTAYANHKWSADNLGVFFTAYHWLNHGNITAQARFCFRVVGPGVPLMIDAEDVAGNTGYAGPLTVADILDFATQYRALGGTVHLVYLPHWYWQGNMRSRPLTALNDAGLHLVSSYYTTYSDNGPGWNGYGGMVPVQWQYTSTPLDMNAFKGTLEEYKALVGGTQMAGDNILANTHDRVEAMITMAPYGVATSVPLADEIRAIKAGVSALALGVGGLSAEDRAAIQALTDAVTALNSRLSTP